MSGDRQVGAIGDGRSHRSASALARCLAIDAADFAEQHWGRRPLLTRGGDRPRAEATFSDLLDADAVDELVSERGLRTPFLRMAKGGTVIGPQRFTRSGGAGATVADQVADDKILDQLANGATLVLQALHRTWPPVIRFSSVLAAEIGHPVQVNAYITPPENQGFAAHYDNHDVFVLQVSGRKRWRVHEPVVIDPLPGENWEQRRSEVAARAAEPPLLDTVLEPGDALYLPRGYLHSATALGDLTIHLTIGVHPLTQNTLLRHLVEVAGADAALRTSLPMGVDLSDPAVLAGHLAQTAEALAAFARRSDPGRADAVAARIGAALAADTRPEPLAPLAQGAAAAALTTHTRLRLRGGLRYRLETAAEQITLRVIDKSIRMPIAVEPALKQILARAEFSPGELVGIDPEEQLVLSRRLLREGVVVPAGGASTEPA